MQRTGIASGFVTCPKRAQTAIAPLESESRGRRVGITSAHRGCHPEPRRGVTTWESHVKKLLLPGALVAGAGLAMAGTLSLSTRLGVDPGSASIQIVSGGIEAPVTAPPPAASTAPAPEAYTALTSSAGSTEPAPGTTKCGLPSQITLQDRVWFGAYWQLLTTPIVLGGYVNARIERTSEGDFFDGIVDKVDGTGRVTDVILAFAGAQGLDAVQGESILAGIPLDEAMRATQVYERLLDNPRYANARIHVTGHSLGTGYTQYILAYALKTHGVAATDARSDFLGFGAPNWLASAAAHFEVDPEIAAARMVDFTAANDPVLLNGVVRIGINNSLPAFTGLPGLGAAVAVIGAHWPTTYAAALGLPDWLSSADQKVATSALSAQFKTGDSISPTYGPTGGMPLTVDGSSNAEWIMGLAGPDRLIGHGGGDVLTGGVGADRFVYLDRSDSGTSPDREDQITDFSASEGDRIDLSALAVQLLAFIGTAPFTGPGQVRVTFEGGATLVMVNLDADPSPETVIRLSGTIACTSRDFIL